LQLVDHFSNKIVFHSPDLSNDEGLFAYSSKFNLAFEKTQKSFKDTAVILDGSVKALGSATAVIYIWKDNKVTACLKVHTNNVSPLKAELMTIHISLISAMESLEIHQILVITNSLKVGKKIISLDNQYL